MQLTESEWFTIEQALCDALAFYRYEASNTGDSVDKIQSAGQVLRKIRKECLKIVERGNDGKD